MDKISVMDEASELRQRLEGARSKGKEDPAWGSLYEDLLDCMAFKMDSSGNVLSVAALDAGMLKKTRLEIFVLEWHSLLIEAILYAQRRALDGDDENAFRLEEATLAFKAYFFLIDAQKHCAGLAGVKQRLCNLAEKEHQGNSPHALLKPLFDQAYSELEAGDLKRIGYRKLHQTACQIAGPDHPHRSELSEHHAREYLKSRRLKKNGIFAVMSPVFVEKP